MSKYSRKNNLYVHNEFDVLFMQEINIDKILRFAHINLHQIKF